MEIVNKEKPWILFGAGDEGRKLALALKDTNIMVYAFADNDKNKVDTYIEDKKVISFEEMVDVQEQYQVVVSVSKRHEKILFEQLRGAKIEDFFSLEEAYNAVQYDSIHVLQKYQGMYEGKRCFIIGTGPSLTTDDLEVLDAYGEITIASNKIFKIFEKTKWRPDIYCAIDDLVLKEYGEYIITLPIETILLANFESKNGGIGNKSDSTNIDIFRLIYKPYEGKEYPAFSSVPDRYVVEGFSVTYAIMQWAAYMGFKELYLLGIDFDYGNAEMGYKHFISNYDGENEKVRAPRLDKCLKAYEKAEMYSRENGFRIYNATRGGKLEVFERVDFDSLFENKE